MNADRVSRDSRRGFGPSDKFSWKKQDPREREASQTARRKDFQGKESRNNPHSAIPWTAAYQAPPSMGFSRQEYWSGVPLPSPKLNKRIMI